MKPRAWLCQLSVLLALGVGGCSTVSYRSVQTQFEEAVRADNERFTNPYTDAAERYRAIAEELTPDAIARLEDRLRPNAWTIRAVSLWRAGELNAAAASAAHGRDEIAGQPSPQLDQGRDSVVLTMLPGLIEDSRLRRRLQEHGVADVAANYDDYAVGFRAALVALEEGWEKMGVATPAEVVAYWNYQCWRVLQNWLFVVGQLPLDKQAAANREADRFVASSLSHLGAAGATTLPGALQAVERQVPEPYRQLIELERSR
jgi:hypothetical protein